MIQSSLDVWRDEARKRLELAKRLRYTNPVMSVGILCDILDELLKR
jgi:hypothetical protein